MAEPPPRSPATAPDGPPPPAPDGPPPPRSRAPGAYLNLPLWQRYAVALLVAVILLTGMVIWVNGHNTDSGPTNDNPASTLRANREAEVLVSQDQAPHSVRLPAGLGAQAALERVLHGHIAAAVRDGAIAGPLKSAHCRATGARSGARVGFSCTVNSGSVNFPFLAAVDTEARRVTYCKRDPPPVPSETVPVSSRCRA
jgi:hypothetical protein